MGADVAPPGCIRMGRSKWPEAHVPQRHTARLLLLPAALLLSSFSIWFGFFPAHDMVRKGAQRGHDDDSEQGYPCCDKVISQ